MYNVIETRKGNNFSTTTNFSFDDSKIAFKVFNARINMIRNKYPKNIDYVIFEINKKNYTRRVLMRYYINKDMEERIM